MEYWRWKSLNIRWKRLWNIPAWAEKFRHKRNLKAHRQAKQWYKIVKGIETQGNKFLNTHPSEDLETALKALEIAEGSLEEVAEHYE